jgi:hypothetical protein
MIGKFIIGKSFRGCLLYCLNDKQEKGHQEAVKDRAEVLLYNQCFGNDKELVEQFNDVRRLNQKVAKPVLHITLSLAPSEQLARDKLTQIAEDCAVHFGFSANQYVAIVHRDTGHQHLHMVVNRIGLDGRTVSDSNSYQKMAALCRKMEAAYHLQPVLSPKRFLPKEQRTLPRLDQRKEELKKAIQQCLANSHSYDQFKERMKALGYRALKGRGISFLDGKGVKVKGSEVGYSLGNIRRLLEGKVVAQQNKPFQTEVSNSEAKGRLQNSKEQPTQSREKDLIWQLKDHSNKGLDLLLSASKEQQAIAPEWLKKKHKKNTHRPRL